MAMAAVGCVQEEKKDLQYLEGQIGECPVREKRFIKRGVEYLCLKNVYDVLEIKDDLIDSYMPWLQEQGIQDRKLIRIYQKNFARMEGVSSEERICQTKRRDEWMPYGRSDV